MKAALRVALGLSVVVILMGVGIWFLPGIPVLIALILSGLYVCSGVIFGSIIIELLREG